MNLQKRGKPFEKCEVDGAEKDRRAIQAFCRSFRDFQTSSSVSVSGSLTGTVDPVLAGGLALCDSPEVDLGSDKFDGLDGAWLV
jgi:hypothetical protein